MVLPIAMALMGLGAARRYQQDRQNQADIEEERAARREDRQAVKDQRGREEQLRASMVQAASPATVDPNMVKSDDQDNRDVGQPGEAAPTQQGFRVNGQQFASMEDATKAAEAYNAPDAVTARMSTALLRGGKPVEAQQLRAGARQEKVADLQLNDMQRNEVNRRYDEQLAGVGSFDALGEFLTNSKGDGRGGALQVKAVPSADGKSITVHQVNPDGTTTATPYSFSNDAKGLTQAKLMLAKSATTADKLAHLHQQFLESQSTKQLDSTISHQAGMLKVAQQQANTQEQYRRDQIRLAGDKADATKKDPLAKMSEADKLTLNDLNKRAEFINQQITKSRAEGNWKDGDANAIALQKELAKYAFQARQITSKYEKEQPSADPMGVYKGQGTGTSTTTAAAPTPAPAPPPVPTRKNPTSALPTTKKAVASMLDANPDPADPPEGKALDDARKARVQAQQALQAFGLQQRAANPQGFLAAQAAFAAAQAGEAQAEQNWQRVVAPQVLARMSK